MSSIFEKFPWKENEELFGEVNFRLEERRDYVNSVIFWFSYELAKEEAKAGSFDLFIVFRGPNEYLDAVLARRTGEEPNTEFKVLNVEFEEYSAFKSHGHDPKGCDLIVCANHNWKEVYPNEKCPLDAYVVGTKEEKEKFFPKEEG